MEEVAVQRRGVEVFAVVIVDHHLGELLRHVARDTRILVDERDDEGVAVPRAKGDMRLHLLHRFEHRALLLLGEEAVLLHDRGETRARAQHVFELRTEPSDERCCALVGLAGLDGASIEHRRLAAPLSLRMKRERERERNAGDTHEERRSPIEARASEEVQDPREAFARCVFAAQLSHGLVPIASRGLVSARRATRVLAAKGTASRSQPLMRTAT
jgi:hypothetical protein